MADSHVHMRPQTEDIALKTIPNSDDARVPSSETMDRYNIFYTTSRTCATLHAGNAESPAEYYFESKLRTIRKPQLYLRKGASKTSPTIGVVKVQWTSKHMLIARGDYEHHENQVTWDQLYREKNALRCSDYFLSVSDSSGEATKLQWRKDRSKPMATVYDCVDGDGTVIAKLRSGGGLNWKKGGEIEVSSSLSEALKEWLLISGMGIWTWEALDYHSLLQGYDKKEQKTE